MAFQRQAVNFINVSAFAALLMAAPAAARVITSPESGAALFGYDPVAFFTSGEAKPGDARYEAGSGSLVWRFASEANREAFLADQKSYEPGFHGYDPVLAARGIASAGNPEIFLIKGGKLYFFRSLDSRLAFAADAEILGRAEASWPKVQAQLQD